MTLATDYAFSIGRPIRTGMASLAALGAFCAAWLLLAPVSGSLTLTGTVGDPRTQPRIVARESGTLATLAVSEGQNVATGQLLFGLATDDIEPQLALTRQRILTDQLARARALAVIGGSPTPLWPDALRDAVAASADLAARARSEQRLLDAARAELAAIDTRSRSQRQMDDIGIAAIGRQLQAAEADRSILAAQAATQDALAKKGLAATDDLIRVQRDLALNDATLARLAGARASAEDQQRDHAREWQRQRAALVSATENELRQIDDRLQVAASDLQRLTVARDARAFRAPASGVVADLQLTAPGDTVIAGTPLLRIIPPGNALAVTVRLPPDLIAAITPGTRVHLRSHNPANPDPALLDGMIAAVSPSPVTIGPHGDAAFLATVRLDAAASRARGLTDGQPIEVLAETAPAPLIARLLGLDAPATPPLAPGDIAALSSPPPK